MGNNNQFLPKHAFLLSFNLLYLKYSWLILVLHNVLNAELAIFQAHFFKNPMLLYQCVLSAVYPSKYVFQLALYEHR